MLPLPPGGAAHLFFLAAVAALVGGLSAIERKGALQLMLSRPIVLAPILGWALGDARGGLVLGVPRSEEHTSELQSRSDLVCRLLLEKKKRKMISRPSAHCPVPCLLP